MELNNILQFKQSLNLVFEAFSEWELSYDEIKEMGSTIEVKEISVAIGMTGDFFGYVYISMDTDISKEIASQMLGGMEISEIDELVISAVGELSNMIMGNSCAQISQTGYQVDITPPSVIMGTQMIISNDATIYRIPVFIKNVGTMQLDIALQLECS